MTIPLRNSTVVSIVNAVGINENQIGIINAYQINCVARAFKEDKEASFYKLATFNRNSRNIIYKAIVEGMKDNTLTPTELAKGAAKELKLNRKSLRLYRKLSRNTLNKFNQYE